MDDHRLPWCEAHGACGMVQANAYGIHHKSFCRCRGSNTCSRSWDLFDGRSITQVGSNQFKFCERAPEVLPCSTDELAYEYTDVHSKVTGARVKVDYRILCQCPETATFELADYSLVDTDIHGGIVAKYACVPMKLCENEASTCKAMAESRTNIEVSVHCLCPRTSSCPTITSQGVNVVNMGKGKVHYIRCQDE